MNNEMTSSTAKTKTLKPLESDLGDKMLRIAYGAAKGQLPPVQGKGGLHPGDTQTDVCLVDVLPSEDEGVTSFSSTIDGKEFKATITDGYAADTSDYNNNTLRVEFTDPSTGKHIHASGKLSGAHRVSRIRVIAGDAEALTLDDVT